MNLWRSLLYVPASRMKFLTRLPDLAADALVIDLEDGVAPVDKKPARAHLRQAVAEGYTAKAGTWMLRVNGGASPWLREDLDLAGELRPPVVVLPKAEDPAAVAALAARFAAHGSATGLMIETARGVGRVRELAAAHHQVAALIFGSADYRLSLGARPDEERRWELPALQETLLAARMAGCQAIDSVYFHFRDQEGLRRHAAIARGLGFDGKSAIHPDQLPVIHSVFSSTAEEIAWAETILAQWREQEGDRSGVIVVDGEMIEALHRQVAEKILQKAPKN